VPKKSSRRLPPKLVKLPPFSPASSQALADRLHSLHYTRDADGNRLIDEHDSFAADAGVSFEKHEVGSAGYGQRLSRWRNDAYAQADLLGEDNYRKLASHLLAHHPYLANHLAVPVHQLLQAPDYHALAPILSCEIRLKAREVAIDRMAGSYQIYRPSMRQDDYGYLGLLDVTYDEAADAFRTRERYVRSDREKWDMPGALYPITHDVFMIVTVDVVDQTIQAKYINHVPQGDDGMLMGMDGFVADMDKHHYYTCRIAFERITKRAEAKLDFIKISDMPQHIQDRLSMRLKDRFSCLWTEE